MGSSVEVEQTQNISMVHLCQLEVDREGFDCVMQFLTQTAI